MFYCVESTTVTCPFHPAVHLQAHCHFVVVKVFTDKLGEVGDTAIHSVLSTLALLYAMQGITKNSGDFLQVKQ